MSNTLTDQEKKEMQESFLKKVEFTPNGVLIKEVYNSITFETNDGERLHLCMRDTGFEFTYAGESFSAQRGTIIEVPKLKELPELKWQSHT